MMNDPELQELFSDPADKEVIDLLQSSRPATPPLDPHFRNYLRAKLMTEARQTLAARPRRRWFTLGPMGLAPAMAAVAAGFIVVLGVEVYLQRQPGSTAPVAADIHAIDNRKDVATAEPITIPFSGPVDKNAVEESINIEPATSFTRRWDGQTLVITPAHPLAPNTTYKVTIQPKSTPPAQGPVTPPPAPRPVVVHFLTARAPIPPVVPPSFSSTSVTWSYDNRIPDSSALSAASWTPDGQLLVTGVPAPASPTATASATASASASPAAAASAPAATRITDVWLMSTQGTRIRILAPGGSLPAAATSGGMFADWLSGGPDQSYLEVRDFQGAIRIARVATINGRPDRAPVWLATDRLAYVDQGTLRIVDLHGVPITAPALPVSGSFAASPSGLLLAVQSNTRSDVLDLTSLQTKSLPDGATNFAWSPRGDLAFTIATAAGTQLYRGTPPAYTRIATSPAAESWSDLNWAPDSSSLLFVSRSGNGDPSRLALINADGSALTAFGGVGKNYGSPQWSPHDDLVLFTRKDEAGGRAFWTAKVGVGQPSAIDTAEGQALAEVEKFMQARIRGDIAAAQSELDAAGLSAYQSGASSLLSPGAQFDRYYPVSVQLAGPNKFLVGARIFIARSAQETSFFEEQLTLVLQDQHYLIDTVSAGPTVQLGHGPTVVSVVVRQGTPSTQVLVRFDSDLKPETVSSDTILIKDDHGGVIKSRATFDPDDHLVTLDAKLHAGRYTLVVTPGVTDIKGAPIAQEYDAPLVIGG